MEIVGYHGTHEAAINPIIKNGYRLSDNTNWLGSGVYFFGDFSGNSGSDEAYAWAKIVKKFNSFGIFESKISSDNFIDLFSNIKHRVIYDAVLNKAKELHLSLGFEESDFLESTVFVKIDEAYSPEVVIAWTEGAEPVKFVRHTIRRPQLQICVKNRDCIKTRTLIRKGP